MNSFAAPSAEKPEYMRKQSKKGTKKSFKFFILIIWIFPLSISSLNFIFIFFLIVWQIPKIMKNPQYALNFSHSFKYV